MRQRFPAKLTDGEEEGFREFAKQHYREAIKLAFETVEPSDERFRDRPLTHLVFDKVASPLVYFKDAWRDLSPDEKKAYYPKQDQEQMAAEEARVKEKVHMILEGGPK